MTKTQGGFKDCELTIVFALIGIIVAIAVPNLLAARRKANMASAIQTLRNVHSAQMTYSQGIGKGNFTTDICTLGGCLSTDLASFDYVPTPPKPSRYKYIFWPMWKKDATPTTPPRYWAVNRPTQATGAFRTGSDIFYVDETGVIRHSGSPTIWPDKNSAPIQ